jgi:hypothetical protein
LDFEHILVLFQFQADISQTFTGGYSALFIAGTRLRALAAGIKKVRPPSLIPGKRGFQFSLAE